MGWGPLSLTSVTWHQLNLLLQQSKHLNGRFVGCLPVRKSATFWLELERRPNRPHVHLGSIKWSMAVQIPSCYKNQFSKNIVLHSVMEKETHCWPKTLAVTTMEPNFRARNSFLLCPVNHDNDEDDDKVKGKMKMMRATYLEHWQRRRGRGLEGCW